MPVSNPILLSWDRSIEGNARVQTAIHAGIAAVHAHLPRTVNLIRNRPLGRGKSVDDHLDAGIYGSGVEHDAVQGSRAQDPWRAETNFDYTDLLVIDRDLVVGSHLSVFPYVLGFAGDGVAMVSVHRMRSAISPTMGLLVISLVVAHELVHSYGLVPTGARREDPRGGPVYSRHCSNPACTMHQFGTVTEGEALLARMGGRILFCAECARDLNSLRGRTFAAGRKTYGVTFR